MTKAFIERVKKELTVYTQTYIYYGGYVCGKFIISRSTLSGKNWKVVYTER